MANCLNLEKLHRGGDAGCSGEQGCRANCRNEKGSRVDAPRIAGVDDDQIKKRANGAVCCWKAQFRRPEGENNLNQLPVVDLLSREYPRCQEVTTLAVGRRSQPYACGLTCASFPDEYGSDNNPHVPAGEQWVRQRPGAGPGRIPEHCGVGFMIASCPSLVLLHDSKESKNELG